MLKKIYTRINSFWIFLLVFGLFGGVHLLLNYDTTVGSLSSDVWLVQYVKIQETEAPWEYVPPFYNQERFYIAYPLLYALNPGLAYGMGSYHIAMIILITLTYFATGLVLYKFFRNWTLAALGAVLFLILHNVFLTNIGLLGFRNFRGLAFVFFLYPILSYYWIVFGIEHWKKNILLGALAALSVYLYPPFGVILVPLLVVTAFIIHGRSKVRPILMFTFVYLLGSSLFWYGHFSNPHSGMLDVEQTLSAQELQMQADIIDYSIADGSLRMIEWGAFKRSLWDSGPFILLFVWSLWFYFKYSHKLEEVQKKFFKVTIWALAILFGFVAGVELVNFLRHFNNQPPVFIEHLRLLRFAGFLLIVHAIFALHLLLMFFNRRYLVLGMSAALVLLPLTFSAPAVRAAVRMLVPTDIREAFNLAPIVPLESEPSYRHVEKAAVWAREYIDPSTTKFFVFDDAQREFQFKVLSRHETNMTVKEGSLWITSGFENSARWYRERQEYDKRVKEAETFAEALTFARSLDATHILLPKGKLANFYDQGGAQLPVLYANPDYRILDIR